LRAREGDIIREYKLKWECINKRIEGRTSVEYRKVNKDKINNYHKEFYEANKFKLMKSSNSIIKTTLIK